MRTTVTIDDDVLAYARAVAQQEERTIGDVLSALARAGMRPVPAGTSDALEFRDGIPLLPVRKPGVVVTLEHVNALRDELP